MQAKKLRETEVAKYTAKLQDKFEGKNIVVVMAISLRLWLG